MRRPPDDDEGDVDRGVARREAGSLNADSVAVINAYWAARLGYESLPARGLVVIAHGGAMTSYRGVYAWLRGEACVVSAPALLVERITAALRGRTPGEMLDAGVFVPTLRDEIERVVGPAAIGYADATNFIPADERGARPLGPADAGTLRALSEASGEAAWEHSGIEFDRPPIFGCFAGAALAAAASYEVLGEAIAHVGFVTHPAHRDRGLGRAVACAATAHALAAGLIAQWQALESNAPSMAVGRALGYQRYCRSLAMRLK